MMLYIIQVVFYVFLYITHTSEQCLDKEVDFKHGKDKEFEINILAHNKQETTHGSLHGAPLPNAINIENPEEKVVITSQTQVPFTVVQFEFEFRGSGSAIVRFMSDGVQRKKVKIPGKKAKFVKVTLSAGVEFPERGLIDINSIEILSTFAVKGIYLRACLQKGGDRVSAVAQSGATAKTHIELHAGYVPKDRGEEGAVNEDVLSNPLLQENELWQPDSGTREEFFKRFGLTEKQFKFLSKEVPEVKNLISKLLDKKETVADSILFGDALLLPKEVKALKEQVQSDLKEKEKPPPKEPKQSTTPPYDDEDIKEQFSTEASFQRNRKNHMKASKHQRQRQFESKFRFQKTQRRSKRKLTGLNNRWSNAEILYKVDNVYTSSELQVLDQAIAHWEENTCIKFTKLKLSDSIAQSHVLITNHSSCWSTVGRNDAGAQILSLGTNCLLNFATPTHEIGHVLGFHHEQARPDRNKFVKVIFDNIPDGNESNFITYNSIDTLGVAYDSASIMHYSSTLFGINGSVTIETLDKNYQMAMGQTAGLSFYDKKIANLVYCKDVCPPLNCKKGGYPNFDPQKCDECICPDGLGGRLCTSVGPSDNGCFPNSQEPLFVEEAEKCVESPFYGSGGYSPFSSCNWILKAESGRKIRLQFRDNFHIVCSISRSTGIPRCFHWVEIKMAKSVKNPGPKFCCTTDFRPETPFISTSSTVVISFRSNFDTKSGLGRRTGFRLCYKLA